MSINSVAAASPVETTPFDHIAEIYDEVFTDSPIGRAQREAVWSEMDRIFRPGQHILEVNCGTGLDAAYLAQREVKVLACDSSTRMIEVAKRRLKELQRRNTVELRVLASERIAELTAEGPFDGALSNFGGLNCVEDLRAVARNLAQLLRPGATALLCILGRSAAWEIAWHLGQGKLRKAFRRFRRGGALGRLVEGVTVQVHYPSVRGMVRTFGPEFDLVRFKGIGVTVPPSYVNGLAQRFPRVLHALVQVDGRVSGWPLLRALGDHILFEFRRVTP